MPLPLGKKPVVTDFASLFPALPPSTLADPIRRELQRRIDASHDRRRAAAISPGNDEDFVAWTREVARGGKLALALMRHLSRA